MTRASTGTRVGMVCLTAALFASLAGVTSAMAQGDGPLRVYVITIDGLKPDEVGPLTPNLNELRGAGTWYDQARAVFPAETLPNHVAMMTGVLPEDSGVVGNQFYTPQIINSEKRTRHYMDKPVLLERETLITRLEKACVDDGGISTATVMSKTYLHGVFEGESANPADPVRQRGADFHWKAPAYIPQSDHIFDAVTMDAFTQWVDEQDTEHPDRPQFAFVNLGDVDRSGHADQTGIAAPSGLSAARRAALQATDERIGLFIDDLKAKGVWDETVLIINSDHGMDWGPQSNRVDPTSLLSPHGYINNTEGKRSHVAVVGSGGAGFVYVYAKPEIPKVADILSRGAGVEFVATKEPVPGRSYASMKEMGLDHPNAPDIMVFAQPGWHVDDTNHQNPLPGNHAHPITQRSTLMVSGGHPNLADNGATVDGPLVYDPDRNPLFAVPDEGPGNMSVAPTVAQLFGIGDPEGGYAVPPLAQAFDPGYAGGAVCDPATDRHADDASIARAEAPADPDPLITVAGDVTDADFSGATYRITVANPTAADAEGVEASAPIPQGVTFASSSPAPSGSPDCVAGAGEGKVCTWVLGTLPPGESRLIDLSVDWLPGDNLAPTLTVQATGAGLPTAQIVVRGLEKVNQRFNDATFVDDRESKDTNHGACPELKLSRDGSVSSYVDNDFIFADDYGWSLYPPRPSFDVFAARVLLNVKTSPYTAATPGLLGLHQVVSGDWNQGANDCTGAPPPPTQAPFAGANARSVRTGYEPQVEAAPAFTAEVRGAGLVALDVTEALNHPAKREIFNGFGISDRTSGAGPSNLTTFDASAGASGSGMEVVIFNPSHFVGCVDVDPSSLQAAGNEEVLLHVTATHGTPISNGESDGCLGSPASGVEIFGPSRARITMPTEPR